MANGEAKPSGSTGAWVTLLTGGAVIVACAVGAIELGVSHGGGEATKGKGNVTKQVNRCLPGDPRGKVILQVVGVNRSEYSDVATKRGDHVNDIRDVSKPKGDFTIGSYVLKDTETTDIEIVYKVPEANLSAGEYTAQGATNYFEGGIRSHFELPTSVGTYGAAALHGIAKWDDGQGHNVNLSALEHNITSSDVAEIVYRGHFSEVCGKITVTN